MSAAEEHLLSERIEELKAEVKSQAEHIELLNQCDNSSTEVIGEMDTEIEKLKVVIVWSGKFDSITVKDMREFLQKLED